MKKLWVICGLLLAIAVCGNNRVLGATPEGSDTIFMRFENYYYIGSNGDVCQSEMQLIDAKYVDVVVEIATNRGKTIVKMSLDRENESFYWGKVILEKLLKLDTLKNEDFTLKFYGYESGLTEHVPFGVTSLYVGGSSEIQVMNCKVLNEIIVVHFNNSSRADLYVNNCRALKNIEVSYYWGLTSLQVLNCDSLIKIDVRRRNRLSSMEIQGCSNLKYLYCGNCFLEYDNHGMPYDYGGSSTLSKLDLSGFPKLEILDCAGLQLTSLDVRGNPGLKIVDCSRNQLTSLDVRGNPELKMVDCSRNQLTSLDVRGLNLLDTLLCSNNLLISLGLDRPLSYVNCDSNCLMFLDLKLWCKGECGKVRVTPFSIWEAEGVPPKRRKFVSCVGVNWDKFFDMSDCTALEELDCSDYQFISLNVSGCTALERLDCANNQLTSLNVNGCTALRELNCSGNQLESLDVSGYTALETLGCSYNQLESLDVSGCTALETLGCSYNQLESLDVSGCTALKGLGCSYNQLESLDVSGCTALGSLSCSTNRLTSLELGLYHKLGYLRCSDNQLTFLDLYDISNMELCVISGNHISGLLYTGEAKMSFIVFGDNCFPLHKCHELSKWLDVSRNWYCLYGGSQYVPVALGINEHYDLHADMELDGVKTTLRVTRKGGGYLDPKLYSVENGWLSFSEKGEYTVEMTNPKVRDHAIEDNGYTPISTALVSVFLDVRVGMPDEPNEPNDPNDPNNPNNPNNPDNPNDPNSPNNPDNPTTANEAGGTLTTAALQVYPNPATDVLHVELLPSAASESLQVVRVLSQSGHLCHSFGSGFDNLPVADLPAGLYFIEAETTTGTVLRQKFVKR